MLLEVLSKLSKKIIWLGKLNMSNCVEMEDMRTHMICSSALNKWLFLKSLFNLLQIGNAHSSRKWGTAAQKKGTIKSVLKVKTGQGVVEGWTTAAWI